MRHFSRVAENNTTALLLNAVERQPELWNNDKQLFDGHKATEGDVVQVHGSVEQIWLWHPVFKVDPGQREDPYEAIAFPSWFFLPQARPLIFSLMCGVDASRLGPVSITRMSPGARFMVLKHDCYFSKYQIAMRWLPGAAFNIDNESVEMRAGDAWHTHTGAIHKLANDSADDVIFMTIKLRHSP